MRKPVEYYLKGGLRQLRLIVLRSQPGTQAPVLRAERSALIVFRQLTDPLGELADLHADFAKSGL
ncbi:MAG: hypothetical protein H0V41_00915 [Pseudonocardiales bacterium]|nr:hypothetical protein [Pseudonocardiales bacterium]